ncbi:EamA family transporter [Patescibacteria group bacterium]|nr:EamA family transporter [Patescibacteria group bacterium]
MLWIPIAISSYFLSGLAATVDKVLLTRRIPNPLSYTFYVGLLSIGVFVLAPFGFSFLSPRTTFIAMISGISFLGALYFLYTALQRSEASRALPIIGAASPFFILLLSRFILGESVRLEQLIAFVLFIIGGILLSSKFQDKGMSYDRALILFSLTSAFFFALSFFLSKEVFKVTPFISGFIWTRLGSFVAALAMLGVPVFRHHIRFSSKATSTSSAGFFLANKGIGAVGFLLLNYAIALGPVSLVNAMKGFEYLFVFLFALFLTFSFPSILKESFAIRDLVTKLGGVAFIAIAFIFLVQT